MDGLSPAGFSISGVCVEQTLLTLKWLMPRVEAICLVEWPELSRERMLLRVSVGRDVFHGDGGRSSSDVCLCFESSESAQILCKLFPQSMFFFLTCGCFMDFPSGSNKTVTMSWL